MLKPEGMGYISSKSQVAMVFVVYVTLSHLRSKEQPGLQMGSDYIDVEATID